MANRPILQTLPADLPTNWTQNQIVAPNGSDVGQATQYGYNYLNTQINDAQTAVNTINAAFDNLVGTSAPTPAYGVCSTAAATAAKAVTVTGGASTFTLFAGVSVRILFTNENTASNPTLNVNNTGAIAIQKLSGTAAEAGAWQAGECRDFVYSGTAWIMVAAPQKGDWNLIQEYTTAGTYTYAIPSGYNQIGVFMIGGGGAGGKLCDSAYYSSGDYYDEVTGGCAGVVNCAILNTSDISSLNIVVGQGGNASTGGTTSVTTNTSQAFTALGGSQGIAISNTRDYYNLNMSNMIGGQLPFINTVNFQKGNRVAAGATNQYVSMSSLNSTFLGYLGGAQNTPSQSVNPFEKDVNSARKFLLSAGGCISANNYRGSLSNTNTTNADAPNLILPDIKGGNGKATNSAIRAPSAHGNDATGYGNGGGGMFVWTTYSGNTPDATNVTGGYGSDGAVFIYAR